MSLTVAQTTSSCELFLLLYTLKLSLKSIPSNINSQSGCLRINVWMLWHELFICFQLITCIQGSASSFISLVKKIYLHHYKDAEIPHSQCCQTIVLTFALWYFESLSNLLFLNQLNDWDLATSILNFLWNCCYHWEYLKNENVLRFRLSLFQTCCCCWAAAEQQQLPSQWEWWLLWCCLLQQWQINFLIP